MTRYLFWDDETANRWQYICSLGYICTDEQGNELFRDYELIDPEDDFGFETNIHGITADDIAGKKNFRQYCEDNDFLDLLGGCIFVAHNARSADLAHIRKSLDRYGIALPPIRYIDTMEMAALLEGPVSCGLDDVCEYLGVPLGKHHNALDDALACRDIFWRMHNEFGIVAKPEDYRPGETSARVPRRTRPKGTLGLVNGSNETIEDVLEEFDSMGLLASIDDIVAMGPCAMKFSGVANGVPSKDIEAALQSRGYGSGKKRSVTGNLNKKTAFLAIGDNVGQSKIKDAKENGVHVIALADLLDALDIR
jgi:DNA polymerase-3 subunit epsilon